MEFSIKNRGSVKNSAFYITSGSASMLNFVERCTGQYYHFKSRSTNTDLRYVYDWQNKRPLHEG